MTTAKVCCLWWHEHPHYEYGKKPVQSVYILNLHIHKSKHICT